MASVEEIMARAEQLRAANPIVAETAGSQAASSVDRIMEQAEQLAAGRLSATDVIFERAAREEQPIISGASALEKALDVINTPQQFLFGYFDQRPGEGFLEAGIRGTRENIRFKDVLERKGIESGANTLIGLSGDILLDPAILLAGPAFKAVGKGISFGVGGVARVSEAIAPVASRRLFESVIKPGARLFSKKAFAAEAERDLINLIDLEVGRFQLTRRAIMVEEGQARELAVTLAAKTGMSVDELLPIVSRQIEAKTGAQLAFPFGSLNESAKIVKTGQLPLFADDAVAGEFDALRDALRSGDQLDLPALPDEAQRGIAGLITSLKQRLENILMREGQLGMRANRLDDSTVDYLTHLVTPEARNLLVKLPGFVGHGRRYNPRHASQLARTLTEDYAPIKKAIEQGGTADISTLNRLWRSGELFPQLGPQNFDLLSTDPFLLTAVRRIRGEKALTDAIILQKAALNPAMARPAAEAPEYYRILRLPDDPRFAGLHGLLNRFRFDPEVAGHLEQTFARTALPEGVDTFVKIWDTVQGMWKGITLAPFPAYHTRNVVGNMWNNYLAGMGPETGHFYIKALRLQRQTLGEGLTLGGRFYSTKQLTTLLEDYAVPGRGFFIGELEPAIIKGLGGAPLTAEDIPGLGRIVKIGTRAGGKLEDNSRIAHFLWQLDKGAKPMDAALSVKKYLFDYVQGLTDFEKGIMRRVFPFYSWTRFNVPLQMQAIVSNPRPFVRLSELVQTARTHGVAGQPDFQTQAAQLRNEDKELVPRFVKEGVGIPVRMTPEGDPEYFLLGGWLPAADLQALTASGFFDRVKDLLSPLIKQPIEQLTNYDMFIDQKIEEFPGETKKFLGVPVRRRIASALGNIRLLAEADRTIRAFDADEEADRDVATRVGTLTRLLFGLKGFRVSLGREARRRVFERQEEVRRLRGAVRRGDEANAQILRELLTGEEDEE